MIDAFHSPSCSRSLAHYMRTYAKPLPISGQKDALRRVKCIDWFLRRALRVKIYKNGFCKILIFDVFQTFSSVKALHLLLSFVHCQIYWVIRNYIKCRKVLPSYICDPNIPQITCLKGLIRRKKH